MKELITLCKTANIIANRHGYYEKDIMIKKSFNDLTDVLVIAGTHFSNGGFPHVRLIVKRYQHNLYYQTVLYAPWKNVDELSVSLYWNKKPKDWFDFGSYYIGIIGLEKPFTLTEPFIDSTRFKFFSNNQKLINFCKQMLLDLKQEIINDVGMEVFLDAI